MSFSCYRSTVTVTGVMILAVISVSKQTLPRAIARHDH
jgi:hypothetical protein